MSVRDFDPSIQSRDARSRDSLAADLGLRDTDTVERYKRHDAAIALRVPMSGSVEIDKMIRAANRRDLLIALCGAQPQHLRDQPAKDLIATIITLSDQLEAQSK